MPASPDAAPEDSAKHGPVAATVWPGRKRTHRKPATHAARTVTTGVEASVQLPSLLNLLDRVVAL